MPCLTFLFLILVWFGPSFPARKCVTTRLCFDLNDLLVCIYFLSLFYYYFQREKFPLWYSLSPTRLDYFAPLYFCPKEHGSSEHKAQKIVQGKDIYWYMLQMEIIILINSMSNLKFVFIPPGFYDHEFTITSYSISTLIGV